ncbi:MAG: uridine kinase [Jatrophihabitantaceae bacterium]
MPPRRVTQNEAVAAAVSVVAAREGVTTFIGIDGPGGAGKSTLAARVARAVAGAVVVAVDDFSGPRWAEWDWTRFIRQLRDPLLAGRMARYQRWDWDRDEGAEWHDVCPGLPVIVEGVSSTRDETGVPWQLTMWVDAPADVRLARAVQRDGAAMLATWRDLWIPSEEAYRVAQRPERRVDLVVSGVEVG